MKMKDTHHAWLWQKLAEKCVRNLTKHGFEANFVSSSEQACSMILDMVSDYESFGFGGSDTTRALGIIEALRSRGKTIYDHWQSDLTREDDLDIRLDQGRCDCFFCSANAISATGEIVNVDGIGNRTNAMTFGPKKVVIVAGMNKVTQDIDSALRRVREIAAPMRAKSLGMETPCAETGICSDCNVPQRICRVTAILHRKPMLTDISVILVGQALGF
ncbi:LUD domain-containing protein [Desulfonema magnum]|uniref:LUD domain-containing protein n=1 Tax=Desulfonema magnum TaxID=45655 RepID=A0A975BIH4_9BACT|nr:LUD domain-containing protein [Desulfonema magnum]